MVKTINKLLEKADNLNRENKELRQQLQEAREYINEIKTGNIDALVITGKKELRVYTENTADKTYRVLIEKMNEGAVTLDMNGTILYCNAYFANMVELPLQKVTGIKFKNFIADSSKDRFDAVFKKGWNNSLKEEAYIYSKNGKAIPVLMSVNTFSLDNNFVLSIILTDLTVQKKNQEKLKRRTKQLEQKNNELESVNKELAFQIKEKERHAADLSIANTDIKELDTLNIHKENILAILSHDLRSPLNNIIGMVEYLKSSFNGMKPEEIKNALDHLYKSSTDELDMLDYLVEWARIKYAMEAFSPVKIELAVHVTNVFDILRRAAAVSSIDLYNEIEDNTTVFADRKMLHSILQNIISNALKYTPPGGKIIVAAKRKEDKILVEIKDTGTGMSKKILDKLFIPQMDSLSKARKDNKGAGIGLLLVKGFLEKTGGEIWVESIEGAGTSFYFTLPKAAVSKM